MFGETIGQQVMKQRTFAVRWRRWGEPVGFMKKLSYDSSFTELR
jgi:hypothetical protein